MTEPLQQAERPLAVCHVSSVHPLHDPRIFYLECWSHVRAGFETHYVVQADQEGLEQGVHIHSIGEARRNTNAVRAGQRFSRSVKAVRLARTLDVDIYHLHDPELIVAGIWLRLASGKPVIFDAHEDDVAYTRQKYYIPTAARLVLVALMAILVRLAARFLDAIIVCDQGVADLYAQKYGARNVAIAHNFPRLDVFTAGDAVPQPYDLIYHGTIPRYHLEIAFDVAEELRDRRIAAQWLFFGQCPVSDWAHAELERRGLQDVFTLQAGWLPYTEAAQRVQQAKIGFIPLPDLPKFQTNIPSKLFEFMALQMPVVLSDLPPSRPFVGDGTCAIMAPPGDATAYADAIARLLTDPDLRHEMGQAGRQLIEQRYNWETEANRIIAMYTKVLN